MMKKLISGIFIPAILVAAVGCDDDEPYVPNPMLTDGREWTTEDYWMYDNGDVKIIRIQKHTIVGDTIVSGEKCKLCRTLHINNVNNGDTLESYSAYLEKYGRVYGVSLTKNGAIEKTKLMDFTLDVGDKIKWGKYYKSYGYMRVLSKDQIEVAGKKYRRLIIGFNSGEEITRWVEGIGESHPTEGLIYQYPQPVTSCGRRNTNFRDGDKILFTYEDFYKNSAQ